MPRETVFDEKLAVILGKRIAMNNTAYTTIHEGNYNFVVIYYSL